MARTFVVKASFQRTYDRLASAERDRVKKSLEQLRSYLQGGEAPLGLGVRRLGPGIYEFRIGLALRGVYIDEGDQLVLTLLGSHDQVRRFLRRS